MTTKPSDTIKCDNLIIGAGVIGLAIGSEITQPDQTTILIESHQNFGQETSSRNSEVIHSGIYYSPASNKTRWCIEGRQQLYQFCQQGRFSASKVGKIVVATSENEIEYLRNLECHCQNIGVPHKRLSTKEVAAAEPLVAVHGGLLFPETGIINSHELMALLERQLLNKGGNVIYNHRFQSAHRLQEKWQASVQTPSQSLCIQTKRIINAAGLAAAEISNEVLETQRYEHRFCRGRYFTLSSKYRNQFKHLVYPVPQKHGLGVHLTIDFEGCARLGPDVDWAHTHRYDEIEKLYDCDWSALEKPFVEAVTRYLPGVTASDLSPGLIGIRPKLFVDGKAHPDFLIENQSGFIHCLGIESPGLTSALAIAKYVDTILDGADSQ